MAVIVAQMACEIVSELAFSKYYEDRGIVDLREPIDDLLPNFNLGGSQKVRKLYEALSGDKIGQAAFWKEYTDVVKLRNDIVHKGARTTAAPARSAVEVAEKLIEHVENALAVADS